MMRLKRTAATRLAGNIPARRDQFGGDALVYESRRIALLELLPLRVPPHPVGLHRDQAHHLDPTPDDHVVGAGDHTFRAEIYRLLAPPAFAFQSHRPHT